MDCGKPSPKVFTSMELFGVRLNSSTKVFFIVHENEERIFEVERNICWITAWLCGHKCVLSTEVAHEEPEAMN